MSNKTQLQENNTNLDGLVARVNMARDAASNLPDLGETVQADFAENNPLSAGYVKNRTHYSEWVDTELFPEQTITISGNRYQNMGLMGLVIGETYTVVWNGVTYTCVAETMQPETFGYMPVIFVGNPVFGGGENNNMPFVLLDVPSYGMHGAAAMADGNYTASITGKKEIVHQLPAKYSNEFRVQVVDAGNMSCVVVTPLAEIVAAIEAGMQLYVIMESYWSSGLHKLQRFDMIQASYNKQYLSEAASKEHYFLFVSDMLDDDFTTFEKYIFVIANYNGGDQLLGATMRVQQTKL